MKKGLFGRRRGFGTWGERGQALVEFGLVSVAFFFLTFGVFDLARLFQSWETVQHASRESARYAITGRNSCDGAADRDACIIYEAKHATSGLTDAGDSGVSPNLSVETTAWDFDQDTKDWITAYPDETGKECDQIEVTVTYRHKFVLPVIQAIAPGGIDVVGRQRMTIEPYAPCIDEDGV